MKWLLSENGRQYDPIFLIEAEEWIMLHYNTYHSLWVLLVVAVRVWGPWATSRMAQLRPLPSRQPHPPSQSTSGSQAQQGGEMGLCCWMEGISSKTMVDLTNYLENPALCSSRHSDHQTQSYSTWVENQKHQGNDETLSRSVFKTSSLF